jgi:hypothetical protein
MGYSPCHKSVKCREVSTVCVYILRDVVFGEAMFNFKSLHPIEPYFIKKSYTLLFWLLDVKCVSCVCAGIILFC